VVTEGAPTNCKGRLFCLNTELSRTALGQFKQKAIIPAFIYLLTSISLSLVGRKIYEIGHFVTMPTACEVAEARMCVCAWACVRVRLRALRVYALTCMAWPVQWHTLYDTLEGTWRSTKAGQDFPADPDFAAATFAGAWAL
jgi:hypothetical protein